MNDEIQELIKAVKTSSKPVQEVVDNFFAQIGWSLLKAEYEKMNATERAFLIAKLTTERKTK